MKPRLSSDLAGRASPESFRQWLSGLTASSQRHYGYVGANFNDDEVLSIKRYHTFFDPDLLLQVFPESALADAIQGYSGQLSRYHLSTPFVPGCGFTYTHKVDHAGGQSRGIYFRIACDATPAVVSFLEHMGLPADASQHFDLTGALKYLAIDGAGQIRARTYIYCLRPEVFNLADERSGVCFSAAECLEISADWDDDRAGHNVSVIGLSRQNIASTGAAQRAARVQGALQQQGVIGEANFVMHGYYVKQAVHSAFFFDDKGIDPPRLLKSTSRSGVMGS